ncbi:hypothetical protein BZA77DRAFT_297514 [Pyronema omphalodes]|nr:hypothetical protein BZA77DRAFT_297514 [Pyronema omphalodes]
MGFTAIRTAAKKGSKEILRLLLDRKEIDINVQDNNGYTALACAALAGHAEIVQILLKQVGIDVNLRNNGGEAALSIACNKGHHDIVKVLREDGRIQETFEEEATPSSIRTSEAVAGQPEILCNVTPQEAMLQDITNLPYLTDENTKTPSKTTLQDAQEDESSPHTTPEVFTAEISHLALSAEEELKKTTMQDSGSIPEQPNSFFNPVTDTLIAKVKTPDLSSPASSTSQTPQSYSSQTCKDSLTEPLQRPNSLKISMVTPSVQVCETIDEDPRPSSHNTSVSLAVDAPYLTPSGAESSLSVGSGVSSSRGSFRRGVRVICDGDVDEGSPARCRVLKPVVRLLFFRDHRRPLYVSEVMNYEPVNTRRQWLLQTIDRCNESRYREKVG